MGKKHYKQFAIALILLAITAGALFYYFKIYKKNLEAPDYSNVSDSLFQRIKENPDYLVAENLLEIKSMSLIEYLRTRMLYYQYTEPENPKKSFQIELEMDFPGERGRALIEILEVYLKLEKGKEKIEKEETLDSYEKILKIELLKAELFGEKLMILLFPKKDSESIERFYAYSDRYLKKHYTDLPRSKKIHLGKARREIYGEDFDRLFASESNRRRFELELKINERELSILNEYEKKQAIAELKEKMNQEEN